MDSHHSALRKNPKYSSLVDDKAHQSPKRDDTYSTYTEKNLGSMIESSTKEISPLALQAVEDVLQRNSSRLERSTVKDVTSDSTLGSASVKRLESNYGSPSRTTFDNAKYRSPSIGSQGSNHYLTKHQNPADVYDHRDEKTKSRHVAFNINPLSSAGYDAYLAKIGWKIKEEQKSRNYSKGSVQLPYLDTINKHSHPENNPVKDHRMEIESEGEVPKNLILKSKFQANNIEEKDRKAAQAKMKSDMEIEEDEKIYGKEDLSVTGDASTIISDLKKTATVIGEDYDIKSLREEIENYRPGLEKEMKRIIQDVERMSKGHATKIDVLTSLKLQSEKTISQVGKETRSLLDEAIPKLDSVQKKLIESKKSKVGLEKQRKELEEIAKNKPSHAAEIRKSLDKTNDLLLAYKKEMEDLKALRIHVQEKILKSKESLKLQITKILEFYDNIINRARDVLEKNTLTSVKVDEKKAQGVDLCFVLDCTKSMKDYIRMVMEKAQDIIKTLKSKFGGFSIRIAVLGYRDFFDKGRFEILDFRNDVEEVKKFLAGIEAIGGDDVAEDVNGAFQKLMKLSWESATRVVVHIADAPCHGKDFHDLKWDEDLYHSSKNEKDVDYELIFENFKKKMLNYVFLKIKNLTDKMFAEFQKIYKRSGEKNSEFLFIQDEIKKDTTHFIKIVAKHICTSISITIKQTFKPGKATTSSIKEKEVETLIEADIEDDKEAAAVIEKSYEKYLIFSDQVEYIEPKWESEKFFNEEIQAKIYYLYNENKLKNLIQNKVTFSKETATMVIKTKPFAKGGFNLAYYCKAIPQLSNKYYNMVLKRPKDNYDKAYYFSVLKKNTMAITLSNQFNKLLSSVKTPGNERVYFTRVLVAKYAKKYYMLEAFIEGKIEKYTNNFTFVNEKVPLMSALSHFSYEFTKGKYMLADLQGSNNLLTDPVIHSFNIEFPNQGDMGLKGMLAFFRYHECNHYCKALHLGEHEAQKDRADAILETPTNFDLKKYYKKCKFYYCNKNSKKQNLCETCKKQIDPMGS